MPLYNFLTLACLLFLSVTSNVISITTILTRRPRKITRMYFFLLHLSVADLLTAFLTLTPEIFIAGNESLESDLACKSVKFVQMIGPYLSAYTLVVMTIDRYQTIRFPIHYRIWKQANSNRKIILAWFVAVIFSLPRTIVFAVEGDDVDTETCSSNVIKGVSLRAFYAVWIGVSRLIFPLAILAFCYVNICSVIRGNLSSKSQETVLSRRHVAVVQLRRRCQSLQPKRRRCSDEVSNSTSVSGLGHHQHAASFRPRAHSIEGISRANIRSVRHTVVIIVGFILCSAPAVALQIASIFFDDEKQSFSSENWFFWFVSLNSIVNPWIYISLNRDLQESLQTLICCLGSLCCCCRAHRHQGSQNDNEDFSSNQQNKPYYRPRSYTVDFDLNGKRRRNHRAGETPNKECGGGLYYLGGTH